MSEALATFQFLERQPPRFKIFFDVIVGIEPPYDDIASGILRHMTPGSFVEYDATTHRPSRFHAGLERIPDPSWFGRWITRIWGG